MNNSNLSNTLDIECQDILKVENKWKTMGSGASVLLKAQVYFTDILMVSISVATKIFENFTLSGPPSPQGKILPIETKWL